MVTRDIFFAIVAAIALQRLFELRLSQQNERSLRRLGAIEHAPKQMRWMVLLHASWFVAMVLEVWLLGRMFHWGLALGSLLLFGIGQALRFAAIWALGERWTTKILTLPNTTPVTRGIFRYVRHPNYAGVILELATLPLVHSAWITSVVFTMANGVLLHARIRAEERSLTHSNDYETYFRGRPRFFVGSSR